MLAQERGERSTLQDADSWFYFEEYEKALPLYDSLLRDDPRNDNLQYKIGVCILNDPYRQDQAIPYLEDEKVDQSDLPALKKGILNPASHLTAATLTPERTREVNLVYAKDYRIVHDLQILTRNFRKI